MGNGSGIKNTTWWAFLELLVIPVALGAFLTWLSFNLNESIAKRERLKDYLKDITAIVSEANANGESTLRDNPSLRILLANSKTLLQAIAKRGFAIFSK